MKLLTAFGLAVLLAGALTASACGGSPTAPEINAPSVTQTFSGTLANGGSNSQTFVLSKPGEIDVTMTSETVVVSGTTTPVTTTLSMDIGVWDGTSCGAAYTYPNTVQTGYSTSQVAAVAATYCIRIYDAAGNITPGVPLTYTVNVAHP